MGRCTIVTLGAALAMSGCAAIPTQDVRVSDDLAAQRRIWRLGEYLVETAARGGQRGDVTWRFVVLDDPRLDAHASYDGIIAIDATFAEPFRTDELACIMGHEIGHVIKRHTARGNAASATSGSAILGATVAAAIIAPWWAPLAVFFGGDAIRDVGVATYSRSLEEEADAFAVWLTIAAGYPTDSCERAFVKIARYHPHRQSWLSATFSATHPELKDRIANVAREAARYRR